MVRVKRRYLLFEIILSCKNDSVNFDKNVNEKQIVQAIKDSIQQSFGDYGLAVLNQSIALKRYNKTTRVGIISCYRQNYLILLNSLFLIQDILKIKCSFKSIYLSGTIRGCLKKLEKNLNKLVIKKKLIKANK